MNILVMGGTRFFGRNLVQHLLDEGHAVTLLTSGKTPDSFGNQVERLQAKRSDRHQMESVLKNRRFHVVYDQICFSPNDAQIACDLFSMKVNRYIFTSSFYVYPSGLNHSEIAYDALNEPFRMGGRDHLNHEEGKRFAESVFLKDEGMPVVCARFPIIVGHDDYTGRLSQAVTHILTGESLFVPGPSGLMNVLDAEGAGAFLNWLKGNTYRGSINAASPDALRAENIIFKIANVLNRTPSIVNHDPMGKYDLSLYHRPTDLTVSTTLATQMGYRFSSVDSWLEREVKKASDVLVES